MPILDNAENARAVPDVAIFGPCSFCGKGQKYVREGGKNGESTFRPSLALSLWLAIRPASVFF